MIVATADSDFAFMKSHVYAKGLENTTVVADNAPPSISKLKPIYKSQWGDFWADNYTASAHIAYFDVDTFISAPVTCQQYFDEEGRALMY